MSRRNRRRRSDTELLEVATAILFPDGSDEEQLEYTPTRSDRQGRTVELPDPTPIGSDPEAVGPDPTHTRPDPAPARPDPIAPDQTNPVIPAIQMEQLTALAQALQLAGRTSIKPPSFTGTEDVELFLKQFRDVADANQWTPLERTLHLRGQLSGDAHSCGQADTYDEIEEDLRARYGLTRRMARDKLSAFQLRVSHNIHKQAGEISRLVAIAFPVLPEPEQQIMALDYFSRAWEGKAVPEHLLSIRPANLREAVRATEDFLAIHVSGPRPRAHAVEPVVEVEQAVVSPVESGMTAMAEAIKLQTALLQQIVAQLATRPNVTSQAPAQGNQVVKCFNCGGPHYRKHCPQRQVSNNVMTQQTGNAYGPAQA